MKTKFLFLFTLLSIFTCTPDEEDAFDDSIFGEYLVYYKDLVNPLADACRAPESQSVTKINATDISFRNQNLTFEHVEDNMFVFKYSIGSSGYETVHTLRHYPCADSIVYSVSNNDGVVTGFGKKINGKNCLNGSSSAFEHLACDEGPDNAYCYSFVNTNTNITIGTISEINYLSTDSTDSTNQTIQIGVSESIGITLPTDSSYKLLTGDYWLGDIPSGGKPIAGLFFQKYLEWSVSFQNFKEGHLNVSKSGDTYTLSFNFTCHEDSKWTGYYNGEIN